MRVKRFGLFSVLVFLLPACANVEIGRLITEDDASWIEKGVTTRAEVVAQFGPPMQETPDYMAMQFQSKSTTTTTTTKSGDTQESETITTVESVNQNKLTKAIYLYTQSKGGAFTGIKTTQQQFWIQYDDGIVKDYGFAPSPTGMTIR